MGAAVKPVRSGARRRASTGTRKHVPASPLDKANGREVVWPNVGDLFEASRGVQGCKFVYLIGEDDDGPVKIGTAKDPIQRLRAMQTGNPRRLRVEHVVVGDMAAEKLLHEFWEPYAIVAPSRQGKVDVAPGTEWFSPEIRSRLFPIIETAAAEQVAFLARASGEMMFEDLERIVREAHIAHGFLAQGRDEARLLAAGAGYVSLNRRSRI